MDPQGKGAVSEDTLKVFKPGCISDEWTQNFEQVLQAQELGFRSLKFKARVGVPVEQLVSVVAKATPELTLMVDFDQSYPTVASFLPMGKRLEQFSNLHIEDPIPESGDHVSWLNELNKRVNIPFALTCQDPLSVMEAIRIHACEIINFQGSGR